MVKYKVEEVSMEAGRLRESGGFDLTMTKGWLDQGMERRK